MPNPIKTRIEQRKSDKPQDLSSIANNLWLFAEIIMFSFAAILYGCWMLIWSTPILILGLFCFTQAKKLFRWIDKWNYFEDIVVHDRD